MVNDKERFSQVLVDCLEGTLQQSDIRTRIEKPKFAHLGDLAFPCYELSKIFRKSPQTIAEELAQKLASPEFEKVEAVNGYVNVFLKKSTVSTMVIRKILNEKNEYGTSHIGENQVVTIDFSSPNIAKPFSMGHLRSTVIGNSIALILQKCGFQPIRINYLGDWGTQFGKLIVAYKMWGNEDQVKMQPIKELLRLYVQFHEAAELDESLNEQAREWFKRLENGNEEAYFLWSWFKDESLKEFARIYELLGITFDSYHGEAFYNDQMEAVIQQLKENCLLVESDGAKVVTLDEYSLPPTLIKKTNGTTLYATRDLAAAIYRQKTYHFTKSLYVVGNEQALHFKQVFAVLNKLALPWQKGLVHIPFGMMLKDGKKMSTRRGKVVLLEEVLNEAITHSKANIAARNAEIPNVDQVARQVGTGAVIFHDLKHFRQNDIEFSLEDMLKFEGETGPYVQYTHARACSLLRKGDFQEGVEIASFNDDSAWEIITLLTEFPTTIERSLKEYDPSQIARYVLDVSKAFNKYYGMVRILDEEQKQARLSLVYSVTVVLKEGLRLLGIEAPERM
jgi:arginyl-tRNA synthetase